MLGDLGKLIDAKGFKKLPKVQKIARSGHAAKQFVSVISWLVEVCILGSLEFERVAHL